MHGCHFFCARTLTTLAKVERERRFFLFCFFSMKN
uniref:Uncharacterized protein n=1 Tax=Anguilla anguilla TaxID=7936 RepID=A0A0E9R2M5_ANGAN